MLVKIDIKVHFYEKLLCLTIMHAIIHQKQPTCQIQNITFPGLEFT